ncbi:hypothetical protein F4803DRAFT_555687 [Xylaria telfairii]|nr:hypothetical protein F4803DRAFT_555687 [Xylaria telfairii]
MGLTNGLLGPVLGGVLSFLGAIVAPIVAFALTRSNRARPADEERAYPHNYELINDVDRVHHAQHRLTEYCRALEATVARARRP